MRKHLLAERVTAQELMVGRTGDKMGKDPVEFRASSSATSGSSGSWKAVEVGRLGRSLPTASRRALGLHFEYQGA